MKHQFLFGAYRIIVLVSTYYRKTEKNVYLCIQHKNIYWQMVYWHLTFHSPTRCILFLEKDGRYRPEGIPPRCFSYIERTKCVGSATNSLQGKHFHIHTLSFVDIVRIDMSCRYILLYSPRKSYFNQMSILLL